MASLPGGVRHGTGNAYSNYKCRCEVCKTWCRENTREYRDRNRERFREQRRLEYASNPDRFKSLTKERVDKMRRLVDRYKMMCGCLRCGFKEHPRALQLHHRDPAAKSFTVSISLGRARKVVMAEIRKCDVLCANCHAIVEAGNDGN